MSIQEDFEPATPTAPKPGLSKKFLIAFVAIDAFLILTAVCLIYMGVFSSVIVREEETGPLYLVGKAQRGDYSQTPATIAEIVKALSAAGYRCQRTGGLYYDNPQKVKKEDLRSEAGVFLAEEDHSKLSALLAEGHHVKELPRQRYATAEFPLRNSLSILVGIFKVYPKMNDYLAGRGYLPSHSVELYEFDAGRITYLMPLSK